MIYSHHLVKLQPLKKLLMSVANGSLTSSHLERKFVHARATSFFLFIVLSQFCHGRIVCFNSCFIVLTNRPFIRICHACRLANWNILPSTRVLNPWKQVILTPLHFGTPRILITPKTWGWRVIPRWSTNSNQIYKLRSKIIHHSRSKPQHLLLQRFRHRALEQSLRCPNHVIVNSLLGKCRLRLCELFDNRNSNCAPKEFLPWKA